MLYEHKVSAGTKSFSKPGDSKSSYKDYNGFMTFTALSVFTRKPLHRAKYRILVTGSRGKSSLVRLIFAGLSAAGLDARGRITGVVPRELAPGGERRIVRNAPGHVEEMRWWLRQIPPPTQAIVMENSAVQPELQGLAAEWLRPTLTVWTNARPDHEDAWGPGENSAGSALYRGIPDEGLLLLGAELAGSTHLQKNLAGRRGETVTMGKSSEGYLAANLALAARALDLLGLRGEKPLAAMKNLPPDVADFRIFSTTDKGAEGARIFLASAFSANDLESTEQLFASTGWREDETSVLYCGRRDRAVRLKSFRPFLERGWREVRTLRGDEPLPLVESWIAGCGGSTRKIFGCGNVKGVPLELLLKLERNEAQWILPC